MAENDVNRLIDMLYERVEDAKSPALNPDLWAPPLEESEKHKITYHWLKGHAGHPENERCDRMAVEQSKKYGGRQA